LFLFNDEFLNKININLDNQINKNKPSTFFIITLNLLPSFSNIFFSASTNLMLYESNIKPIYLFSFYLRRKIESYLVVLFEYVLFYNDKIPKQQKVNAKMLLELVNPFGFK
jgi:hypothetical protein